VKQDAGIIDIGGGTPRLAGALLALGIIDVTVLNISENARAAAKCSLGPAAARVTWITADVTACGPAPSYDLWHDRAAFHFLTEAVERQAYAARVMRAVRPGGYLIIGTFAPDGPDRCSGLPAIWRDVASIGAVLGLDFALIKSRRDDHLTPAGGTSSFQFSLVRCAGL